MFLINNTRVWLEGVKRCVQLPVGNEILPSAASAIASAASPIALLEHNPRAHTLSSIAPMQA